MRQAFRNSFLFLMLAVFLTGTTGFSFYIHECSSSNTREIYAFPGIFGKTISCCCSEEMYESVPCDKPVSSFSEPECCKNSHVYLKASFTGFPVFYQFNQQLLQAALPADFLNLSISDQEPATVDFNIRADHPPPRYGKALVHFLHQIKIPAIVS